MAEGIRFRITGHPVPWSRAGAYGLPGGGVRHYTKTKIGEWKTLAGWMAREAMGSLKPFEGCLGLVANICLAVPPSWPDWKRSAALKGFIAPAGRPDLDNYIKGLKDSLNGIVYLDDAQIIHLDASKRYDTAPCVEVAVTFQKPKAAASVRKKDLQDVQAALRAVEEAR